MKTKILFVATEPASGMIPFACNIINALNKSGQFDIYGIFVNNDKKSFKDGLDVDILLKAKFIDMPTLKYRKAIVKMFPFKIITNIRLLCKQESISYIHYITGEFTLCWMTFLFLRKYKLCYTVHNLHPHNYGTLPIKEWFIDKYINCGNWMNMSYIDMLTTNSLSQYNELKEMYPYKRIVLAPFPTLVTEKIKEGLKIVPELKDASNYILFFGSVSYYKGADLLSEACNRLTPSKTLVVAGKGIQLFQTDYIQKRIRINRYIDDSEIKDLFERAAVVVYPYRSATMSGVLSLAYYFKKKVVVSSIPFFTENIHVSTKVFENGNINDLVVKIRDCLNDSSEYCINDFYENKYSEIELVKSYLNLYL